MRLLRLPFFLLLILIYASCKKDSASVNLNPSFYFLNGDTAASTFNKAIVLFGDSDVITFNLIVSSTYLVSKNTDVTIAVADTARDSYNTNHGTAYSLMPEEAYNFKTTFTATDSFSSVYDTVAVTLYKHALNMSTSYMLPIKIVSAGSNAITQGSSVIYLHTITNPLAGIYNSTVIKTLYTGDAADSVVNERDTFSLIKNIVPELKIDTSKLDYADLGSNGWQYNLSISRGNIFTVTPNVTILNSIQAGSFTVLSSIYNSTDKNIYVKSSYKNSNGDERIIEESLSLF